MLSFFSWHSQVVFLTKISVFAIIAFGIRYGFGCPRIASVPDSRKSYKESPSHPLYLVRFLSNCIGTQFRVPIWIFLSKTTSLQGCDTGILNSTTIAMSQMNYKSRQTERIQSVWVGIGRSWRLSSWKNGDRESCVGGSENVVTDVKLPGVQSIKTCDGIQQHLMLLHWKV